MTSRTPPRPPALARWLLDRVKRVSELEFMRGDLDEDFRRLIRDGRRSAARRWYWRQTVSVLIACRVFHRRRPAGLTITSQRWEETVARLVEDIRAAVRSAWRAPTFAMAVIGTLALGIGANSAIFAVVNAVLVTPLGYPGEEDLVLLWSDHPERGLRGWGTGYQTFLDLRSQATTVDVTAYALTSLNVRGADEAERIGVARVSHDFWQVAGVAPALGRALRPEENTPGARTVMVMSHELWVRRFDRDPDLIGKTIALNGLPYTVIGIMPGGFRLLDVVRTPGRNMAPPRVDAFVQLASFGSLQDRGVRAVVPMGRVRDGFDPAAVQREMEVVYRRIGDTYEVDRPWRPRVETLRQQLVGDIRPALWLAFGAAALMLLLACVNVANLVLVRDTRRGSEYALRMALGGSRRRLAAQLMVESATLGLAGGVVGVVMATAILRLLPVILPNSFVTPHTPSIGPLVLLFTVLLSLLAAVAIGVMPVLIVTRRHPGELIREGGSRVAAPTRTLRLFVMAEVAVALMLMVGAGLLARSFVRLLQQETGHRTDGVVTFAMNLSQADYPDDASVARFYRTFLEEIDSSNEVERSAAVSFYPPQGPTINFTIVGRPPDDAARPPVERQAAVTPDYFRVLDVPLIEGRYFTPADDENAPRVVIVSEALARRYWGTASPIGARIAVGSWRRVLRGGAQTAREEREIVGVVGNLREPGVAADTEVPMLYQPHAQDPWPQVTVAVLTPHVGAVMEPVRQAARRLDPGQPIYDVQTMNAVRAGDVARERFLVSAVGGFAVLALVLATLGIYAVISYSVQLRTAEVGIRLALGARPGNVVRLFLVSGGVPVGLGLVVGALGAAMLVRVLQSLLFHVPTTDPLTWLGVVAVLASVSVVATYLPARRAATVDAVRSLRGV